MIDFYQLPEAQMLFWKTIGSREADENFINALGSWALAHQLRGGQDEPDVHSVERRVEVQSAPEMAWDDIPEQDPTRLVQPEIVQRAVDEMGLSSDSDRWIVGELLKEQTCQPCHMNDSQQTSFKCGEKRRCPRCAAQYQIECGYEDPANYLDNAIFHTAVSGQVQNSAER